MEIKYEPVFGDQALFNGMMGDCEFASEEYGYMFANGILYYCERYNEKAGWGLSSKSHLTFKPLAMRRIIRTPTWTVADKKAGKLPEVGSKAVSAHDFCVVDILAVRNRCVVVCNSDVIDSRPCVFTVDNFLEIFKPIESPEEKAARLEDEFIQAVLKEVYYGSAQSMQAAEDAARCAYRKLSGELKMPEVKK